jgi:hypothetical protein
MNPAMQLAVDMHGPGSLELAKTDGKDTAVWHLSFAPWRIVEP